MNRRNQILRQNWVWNRPVGMRTGRRGARRENARIPPKEGPNAVPRLANPAHPAVFASHFTYITTTQASGMLKGAVPQRLRAKPCQPPAIHCMGISGELGILRGAAAEH